MWNVFENEINELQQGSIFSGAKADGFEGQKAYGLIVASPIIGLTVERLLHEQNALVGIVASS